MRWPGKTGGAFGFALIFLFLFLSREKEKKSFSVNKSYSYFSFVCPKEFAVLFALMQSSLYFLCLETKKVTKKIQARPDALPAGQANAHGEFCIL